MRFTATAALSTVLLAPLALAQSSESAAASASASASSSNSSDSNFLTTVLGALTAANLTSLVGVASAIANTTEGMALLGQLAVGNKTVFAPNNEAFSGVSSDVTGNTTLLTEILSYHILNNTYSPSGIATSPSHTIARTLLRGGIYQLPGNRTAPLVLEKSNSSSSSNSTSNSTSFEIVQAAKITPQGPVSALNLQVYIIDQVLDLPGNISAIASAAAPQLAGLVQQTGLLEPLESAVGITVFAPSDTAIAAAQSALGQVTNATLVQNVLLNHVINGSVVYSTELASSNYTSAAGEKFTFSTNATGAYVTSGNSTAQIIASDIIINNGVVHLIDGVLLNLGSNSTAASDAYSSGTAAAATQTVPTGAITATSQPAASGSGGGASGAASSGAAGRIEPLGLTNSMLGGALALCASVIGGAFVLF